jgi:hypothetical protein
MKRIAWCLKQKSGIRKTEPNENLFREYIENAEESLRVLDIIRETHSNMWLATTKYYIEYFAFYSLLMRLGIKCEIHDCSLEIARILEMNGIIPEKSAETLEKDKELRIDNQYYLKNRPVQIDMDSLRNFVLEMKSAAEEISDEDISGIRDMLFR